MSVTLNLFQSLLFSKTRPTWRNACQGKECAKNAQGDRRENRSFEGNVFHRFNFIGTVFYPVYHSYNYNHLYKKKVKNRIKISIGTFRLYRYEGQGFSINLFYFLQESAKIKYEEKRRVYFNRNACRGCDYAYSFRCCYSFFSAFNNFGTASIRLIPNCSRFEGGKGGCNFISAKFKGILLHGPSQFKEFLYV